MRQRTQRSCAEPNRRALARPLLVLAAVVGLSSAASAGTPPPFLQGPWSIGDHEKGALVIPLRRGAAVPLELTVIATPNDCANEMYLELSWDKEADIVNLHLSGEGVLEPFPDVDRIPGVSFFPNPHLPEQEDIEDGRYQLWIVSAAGPIGTFYYDGQTLDLVGSEFATATQPPGTIPVPFPTIYLFPTPMFQPDANGDVDLYWSFPYSGAIRGDRPELAHMYLTFPPPNLCAANPNRLDLSTLRPYSALPVPASEARPWSDYLRGGLLFDVTVEPAEYFTEPPLTTLIGSYSNATAVGGGIPDGYTLDIPAVFGNQAPPIRPWSGAGQCVDSNDGVFTSNINFCQPQP